MDLSYIASNLIDKKYPTGGSVTEASAYQEGIFDVIKKMELLNQDKIRIAAIEYSQIEPDAYNVKEKQAFEAAARWFVSNLIKP